MALQLCSVDVHNSTIIVIGFSSKAISKQFQKTFTNYKKIPAIGINGLESYVFSEPVFYFKMLALQSVQKKILYVQEKCTRCSSSGSFSIERIVLVAGWALNKKKEFKRNSEHYDVLSSTSPPELFIMWGRASNSATFQKINFNISLPLNATLFQRS